MTDKSRSSFSDAQTATGKGVDTMLDEALRELYAHYGQGELPPHLVELAHRLEAARRAALAERDKASGPEEDAPEHVRSRGTGAVED